MVQEGVERLDIAWKELIDAVAHLPGDDEIEHAIAEERRRRDVQVRCARGRVFALSCFVQ